MSIHTRFVFSMGCAPRCDAALSRSAGRSIPDAAKITDQFELANWLEAVRQDPFPFLQRRSSGWMLIWAADSSHLAADRHYDGSDLARGLFTFVRRCFLADVADTAVFLIRTEGADSAFAFLIDGRVEIDAVIRQELSGWLF